MTRVASKNILKRNQVANSKKYYMSQFCVNVPFMQQIAIQLNQTRHNKDIQVQGKLEHFLLLANFQIVNFISFIAKLPIE